MQEIVYIAQNEAVVVVVGCSNGESFFFGKPGAFFILLYQVFVLASDKSWIYLYIMLLS